MPKTVTSTCARANLGQILDEVYHRGQHFIIERSGRAMAAVVPVEQYQQRVEDREAFFAMVEETRKRNRGVSAKAIARDVAAARRAARTFP